ncbi:hypothetical protein GZ77_13880 [Endozoicomonas montiporae]|nr:hypothetical protein GZ77_13880 [Endozoicomonas montiporae]
MVPDPYPLKFLTGLSARSHMTEAIIAKANEMISGAGYIFWKRSGKRNAQFVLLEINELDIIGEDPGCHSEKALTCNTDSIF